MFTKILLPIFLNCGDTEASPRVVFFGVTARNCVTAANNEPKANPSQGSYPWLEPEQDFSVTTKFIAVLFCQIVFFAFAKLELHSCYLCDIMSL